MKCDQSNHFSQYDRPAKLVALGPLQTKADPRNNLHEFLAASESSLACALSIANGSTCISSVEFLAQLRDLMVRLDKEVMYLATLCDFG